MTSGWKSEKDLGPVTQPLGASVSTSTHRGVVVLFLQINDVAYQCDFSSINVTCCSWVTGKRLESLRSARMPLTVPLLLAGSFLRIRGRCLGKESKPHNETRTPTPPPAGGGTAGVEVLAALLFRTTRGLTAHEFFLQ